MELKACVFCVGYLMERDYEIEWAIYAQVAMLKPPLLVIDVLMERWVYSALLESGNSVSMLRAELAPEDYPFVRMAKIASFHGHVEKCPVILIQLAY